MKELTAKEEEVMRYFWQEGALFVRQLVEMYPNRNRISIRSRPMCECLRTKDFCSHESLGATYRYFPIIDEAQYGTEI
jgi:predicted transcriptional regulator